MAMRNQAACHVDSIGITAPACLIGIDQCFARKPLPALEFWRPVHRWRLAVWVNSFAETAFAELLDSSGSIQRSEFSRPQRTNRSPIGS